MRKYVLVVFYIIAGTLTNQKATAQFVDNFGDGNFTVNPAWVGNTADWQINAANQLQSNNTVANAGFYLSTASTLATQAEWEFYVNLTFNTSSANFVDVFLTASQSNLTAANVTGYFVRIGTTDDEISLYRKDASGSPLKIIDGVNGITNTSNNTLKIKVIRTVTNEFSLYRDVTATGNSYFLEGKIVDGTFTSSAFFGIFVRQSTATFFQRHFFDDVVARVYSPDVTPPIVQSVNATTANTVDVLFNEAVETTSAQITANYVANNGLGSPVSAVKDAVNAQLVTLRFAGNFANGVISALTVNGVKDLAGNTQSNGTGTFSFFVPQRYSVVVNEIMAGPTPVVALPNAEYVELRNTANLPINLQGWRLTSLSTNSGPMPSFVLLPDSVVIICSSPAVALLQPYGRVLSVTSFPSLPNTGTTLTLYSKENTAIHSVSYNDTWYQNPVKANGGWSLEMIDTKNPCAGISNWRASNNVRGGSPGAINSVNGINKDVMAPSLLKAAAVSPTTLLLTFSEPLDSSKAALASSYLISDEIGTALSALPIGPQYQQVTIGLGTPLALAKVYTVTATGITDCSGNAIAQANTAKVGVASPVDTSDIVINEILFNPAPAATDYVEIYNRSQKIIDLKDVYFTNRSSTSGALGTLKQLSTDNLLCFPGDYYVLSASDVLVKQNYTVKSPNNFINISSTPSFPDDKGVVVLLNINGTIIDELKYDAKWHFALIDDEEGIALERIDYNKPTQNANNWHSAASTAGFGTPSYQNSQFRLDMQVQGEVTVLPKVFSPDNDGTDDFATITYQVTEPNYVANITIFDASGRVVKTLVKNATLAFIGTFRWDGLNDKMGKLPIGTYVVYTEIFNLNGKKKIFKNAVVLTRRL